jgi:hypothetical protein
LGVLTGILVGGGGVIAATEGQDVRCGRHHPARAARHAAIVP